MASAPTAGEIAHLKKFGKLLATFGTRVSCLLRHLGPECCPEERRRAFRLFAQAAAAVYPGLDAVRARGEENASLDNSAAVKGRTGVAPSLGGIVANVVYPKAMEAFLSAAGPPPCYSRIHGGGAGGGDVFSSVGASSGGSGDVVAAQAKPGRDEAVATTGGAVAGSAPPGIGTTVEGIDRNPPQATERGRRGMGNAPLAAEEEEGVQKQRRGRRTTSPSSKAGGFICPCYGGVDAEEEMGDGEDNVAVGEDTARLARLRRHDPWLVVASLRPEQPPRPPPQPPYVRPNTHHSRGIISATCTDTGDTGATRSNGDNASEGEGGGLCRDVYDESLGAVLLLCEVLRSGDRLSEGVTARLGECYGWVLDHLACLFPYWVEEASAMQEESGGGSGGGEKRGAAGIRGENVAMALCDEVAMSLGVHIAQRALNGQFEEAQVQLLEGCACHPHPLCREVWCNALKVFMDRCDSLAQTTCVQTFSETALHPRVSRRCRRRLSRALLGIVRVDAAELSRTTIRSASTPNINVNTNGDDSKNVDGEVDGDVDVSGNTLRHSAAKVRPSHQTLLRRSCLSRLLVNSTSLVHQAETSEASSHTRNVCSTSSNTSNAAADLCATACGTCALDLLRHIPVLLTPTSGAAAAGGGDGGECSPLRVAAASTTFARTALTSACSRDTEGSRDRNDYGGGGSTNNSSSSSSSSRKTVRGGANVTSLAAGVAAATFLEAEVRRAVKIRTQCGVEVQLSVVEETATKVARSLGGVVAGGRLEAMGLSEDALAAFVG